MYIKAERVILKAHPEYNEKWVQARTVDPKIMGLGDLFLLQQERLQPSGGRLDLLFQDAEDRKLRYEIEIQLGNVDESHIIRTLEYWDIERKRYPQYDHCAVIIAEEMTSRFLNIVSLFNGSIPPVAIQMQAYNIATNLTLIFTTVMDEFARGLVDEDEVAEAAPANRAVWESQASPETVALADQLLSIVREFDPSLQLKYNKAYIGLVKNDRANNFVEFTPRRKTITIGPRLEALRYRISIGKDQLTPHRDLLGKLMKLAFEFRNN